MPELETLFNRLKHGNFNYNDLKILANKIKRIITTSSKGFNIENIEDFVQDVILALLLRLKNNEEVISNPEGYLKVITLNIAEKYVHNYKEIYELVKVTREILEELENDGKIHSYNNKKYCNREVEMNNVELRDILTLTALYDFTEINAETRWTARKKELLSEFILNLLQSVECFIFSDLIEFLKSKMGMKIIKEKLDRMNEEDDENENFERIINLSNQEENQFILNEYEAYYYEILRYFLNQDIEKNTFILTVLYLYYFNNKTLTEIADYFGYSSPSTIQTYLKTYDNISPLGFIKSLTLIDEEIVNHYDFIYQLENRFLKVLEDVYHEIQFRNFNY
ncbi:MAG: hypothetical protein N3F03_05415 [Ignavibacteria bacterium]|nr:hypothetical protein [Ignavibacteria bacterium]